MAFMAKDKIVRTGTDINLATIVDLQTDATALGGIVDAVGGVTMTATDNRMTKVAKVALKVAAGTTAGGVLEWKNPEASAIIVNRMFIRLTGVKSGQTMDIGFSATVAPADNLFDGLSTANAGLFDNLIAAHAGTNGKASQLIGVDEYIVGTASAALTGGTFAGFAYIHYSLV